jgi:NTP pyrophosphatase (non-canonical NTP hydrolase)
MKSGFIVDNGIVDLPQLDQHDMKVLHKALDHWGIDLYLGQTIEEAAEAIQAIKHFERDRSGAKSHLLVELTHVELMISILKIALYSDNVAKIESVRKNELLRIEAKYESNNKNL